MAADQLTQAPGVNGGNSVVYACTVDTEALTGFVATFAPDDQALLRRITVSVLAGVITSAVVTLVFQYVFLVRLP